MAEDDGFKSGIAMDDLATVEVYVPEWKKTVRIRQLTRATGGRSSQRTMPRRSTPGTRFEDFGPGSKAILHGEEAIVTSKQGASVAGMVEEALTLQDARTVEEIRGLREDLAAQDEVAVRVPPLPSYIHAFTMSLVGGIPAVVEYVAAIERGECPIHKRPVTMEQRGSCVYGDCGCRLYQGTLKGAE